MTLLELNIGVVVYTLFTQYMLLELKKKEFFRKKYDIIKTIFLLFGNTDRK